MHYNKFIFTYLNSLNEGRDEATIEIYQKFFKLSKVNKTYIIESADQFFFDNWYENIYDGAFLQK